MTNYDWEQELRSSLSTGEKLVWTGKPKRGIVFSTSDIFFIPFSLLWGGFAFFWETTVVTTGAPIFMKLWGIPFVLVGIYMIIGRFFVDAMKRKNTLYGITPDRIIIKSGLFGRSIKSLNIRTLSDITIIQRATGRGTITLGPQHPVYGMMQGVDWPGTKQPLKLELIEDVKDVYDKIIDLQRQK